MALKISVSNFEVYSGIARFSAIATRSN